MARSFATVRQLIYWEYSKTIAEGAVGERLNFKFINHTYQKLVLSGVKPSSILRENQKLFKLGEVCAYCGNVEHLHWEHIIPLSAGGPDAFDNMVRACAACNLAKGALDPYQWYKKRGTIDSIPRIVLGKLLKLAFDRYSEKGLIDSAEYMRVNRVQRTSLCSIFGAH